MGEKGIISGVMRIKPFKFWLRAIRGKVLSYNSSPLLPCWFPWKEWEPGSPWADRMTGHGSSLLSQQLCLPRSVPAGLSLACSHPQLLLLKSSPHHRGLGACLHFEGPSCLLWNINIPIRLFVMSALQSAFCTMSRWGMFAGLVKPLFFSVTFSGSSMDSWRDEDSPCLWRDLCGPLVICIYLS